MEHIPSRNRFYFQEKWNSHSNFISHVKFNNILPPMCFMLVLLFISSCNTQNTIGITNEELQLLGTAKLSENISRLTSDIQEAEKYMQGYENAVSDKFLNTRYIDNIDTVVWYDEFVKLIDPNSFKCGFSAKLKSKIKDTNWIPEEIKNNIDGEDIQSKILKFKESSSAYIFNRVAFTYKNDRNVDTTVTILPEGSYLFKNSKALSFVNREMNSFIINFDCDGYYKAAIDMGLGGNRNNIRANASQSRGLKSSAFIGMGYVYSPFQYIMETSSLSIAGNVFEFEKFDHLASLLAIARIIGIDKFTMQPLEPVKMMWTSNDGTNYFNQAASLTATGTLGPVSARIEGSIDVNRGARYSTFNSYLIGSVRTPLGTYTKEDISSEMASIFEIIEFEEDPSWDNRFLKFKIRVDEGYCNKTKNQWKIKESGFTLTDSDYSSENCHFTVEGDINTTMRSITLTGKIEGQDVSKTIILPVLPPST